MPKFISKMKKIVVAMVAVSALGIIVLQEVRADTATAAAGGSSTIYLQEIAAYTNSILTAVTTPTNPAMVMIIQALQLLASTDTTTSNPSTPTPTLQNTFTTLSNIGAVTEPQMITANYASLQSDLFGGVSTTAVPNVNDLAYGTVLGTPPVSPDPRGSSAGNPPYNFIKIAAGMGLSHATPGTDWHGNSYDQSNYRNFYNTLTAVETFNGYALSQLYSDSVLQLTAQQNTLIQQASNPQTWFAIVATEPLGAVVRQILMFQSQSYIVQTQLLQTTKLLLAAVTMNNTMIMANNTGNEAIMVMKAVKAMPKSSGM